MCRMHVAVLAFRTEEVQTRRAKPDLERPLSRLANLKAGDGPLLSARRLEVDSELGEHLMPIKSLPSPRAAAARPRHAQTTMPFALAHA